MNISPGQKSLSYLLEIRDISVPSQTEGNRNAIFAGKINTVTNTQFTTEVKKVDHHENRKKVNFGTETIISFHDTEEREKGFRLLHIEDAYRREMDKDAKKNGMPFAAGHDSYKTSPYPYNNDLAVSEYKKLG
ncbi:hypothetical protein [Erwinia sp. ErVv1]|uniref:hypothetical protein n=1 Tax=Erwinia sp. ErVv1 TaxID=1603299 RepID=UPI000835573D|nr:hypothetical protein [Erwinia sp. ErVv1]